MEIEILDSKNGEKTLKVDSLFLHSSYDPSKEAERFVSSLSFPFTPKNIVLIEPGLSYCLKFFRKKFPESTIGFISVCNSLPAKSGFDFELDYLNNSKAFDSYLCSKFSEFDFFNTIFISWPASAKAFPKEDTEIWKAIKFATENIKTLLITREYFEKKWLLNSVNTLINIKKTINLSKKIDLPIVICASGPSLKKGLEIIRENQNKFFIIALSSALSVLLKNNINPDLVFSTDGGFWAGEHLKKCKNLNLALPLEAYCSKNCITSNKILPLIYGDGLSFELKKYTSISFEKCERNGTVSGSALEFALSNSTENIYFFGLDLSSHNGFQHTQPNELEKNNSLKDNRLKTKEKRIYPGSLKNSSLEIYEKWFANKDFPADRINRIIDESFKKNNLGKIKDISSEAFNEICNNLKECKDKTIFFTEPEVRAPNTIKTEKEKLKFFLHSEMENEKVLFQLFPLSCVLLSHLEKDSEQYNLQNNKISKELNKLLSKMDKILND